MVNKIKLIRHATPITKLAAPFSGSTVYMKREDLIDFGIGGSKVRKLEYIFYEVLEKQADKIITIGSEHSNHARITAAVAQHFHIACDIIIISDNPERKKEGNQLLLDFYQAKVQYCTRKDATDYIDHYLDSQTQAGINYYFIPGGAHTPAGALGYADAMKEMFMQCLQENIKIDAIFLPTGTGSTQAGLLYGAKQLQLPVKIVGVSVARKTAQCITNIQTVFDSLVKKRRDSFSIQKEDIHVIDQAVAGYGEISADVYSTMQAVSCSAGIVLDPVYNAKAFAGMKKYLADSKEKFRNVLYINTGGIPSVFTTPFKNRMASS